ncbi:MAG: hypothetical protein IT348_11060 [Candidatus Eisenbacteria bacterium]|nr:hypothetical protein [Candidatus Eisenbacteria bacterium]
MSNNTSNINTFSRGTLPSFFRGVVIEASRTTYEHAGFALARHLRDYLDEPEVEELDRALASDDPAEAVWELIKDALPRCAALVPRRRRVTFTRGIRRAIEELQI